MQASTTSVSVQTPSAQDARATTATPSRRSRASLPFLVAALSAGTLALVALGFALTRPCVLGRCDRLTRAEAEARATANALTDNPSTATFIEASQTIDRVQDQLAPIPPWSLAHGEARDLLARLDRREQQLDVVRDPLSLGLQAAQMSQNPPHSLQDWRQMERLWEAAIAQLDAIDPENFAYSFARAKRREYRDNLEAVQQRAILERRGDEQLEAAQLAAEVARSRQNNARDLETWQQVYASWRTAVRALMRVPTRTTAYDTARQLFQAYRPQLDSAQQRQSQEQIAANLYDRALEVADEAKTAQDRAQWNVATTQWQQALGYAQQIPDDTAYAERSAPLVRAYTNALVQAIAQQELAETVSRANRDLERLCNGSPKICQYQVTGDRILVQLLPDYVNRVRELDREAARQNNTTAQSQLDRHVSRLIDGLELVSLNSGIPMRVLNPDGDAVGNFSPSAAD